LRYIKLPEETKVPIFRNVIWAVRLVWKADWRLPVTSLLEEFCNSFLGLFVRNILFLKTLLTIIDSRGAFSDYVRCLVWFLIAAVALEIIKWYGSYLSHAAVKTVLQRLNNKLFEKAYTLDVGCYEDPAFYDKYQRATTVLSDGYFHVLCIDLAVILGDFVSFLLVVATVISIDPRYLFFMVPAMLVFAVETKKSRAVYRRDLAMTTNNRVKAYIKRTMFLRDYAKDMRTSNIFLVLLQRFEAATKANLVILKEYGLPLFLYSTLNSLIAEFIPIVGTYAYAGYQFIHTDAMTISGFSVVLSAINSVNGATWALAECFDEISQMALFFSNLRDFFNYEPQITDGEEMPGAFESLEFRDVSFRYPGAQHDSLSHVSFTLRRGETLAVVGVNGAGKSTLVKLMMRFYDPTAGEILYNGVPLQRYRLDKLRGAFAAVFQDYRNFAVSVNENVICRPCDETDKRRARRAMEQSGAWDRISRFEKPGDTVLTREFEEDGAGLSGGENQKLSTARLFARDFEIAVLDEPSSALDPVAEAAMYQHLTEATRDKTVVYISHRLSSAAASDRILVLENGRVVQTGAHADLMRAGGIYAAMFRKQAAAYQTGKEAMQDA
jgi:ATP-binding cassette subfamily B protein